MNNEIKAFANERIGSDTEPYEVTRIISDKTVEIRRMSAEINPSFEPEWIAGGFSGHLVNNDSQKWIITSDENNGFFRIRLSSQGEWKDKYGNSYKMSDKPVKRYDFNF